MPLLTSITTPYDFGAIADGNSHPLSEIYSILALAQVIYPHATSLTNEIDWCAIQGAINYFGTSEGVVDLDHGKYIINKDITRPRKVTLKGHGMGRAIIKSNSTTVYTIKTVGKGTAGISDNSEEIEILKAGISDNSEEIEILKKRISLLESRCNDVICDFDLSEIPKEPTLCTCLVIQEKISKYIWVLYTNGIFSFDNTWASIRTYISTQIIAYKKIGTWGARTNYVSIEGTPAFNILYSNEKIWKSSGGILFNPFL